jgi:hypothetical protein
MRRTFRHYTLVLGMQIPLVPAKFRVTLVFTEASTMVYGLTLEFFVLSSLFVFVVVIFVVIISAVIGLEIFSFFSVPLAILLYLSKWLLGL